ncbi:MAG: hypothetical protein D4R64_14305 [Porphyromonadaceae bacterium]|nr:MAG: hypothetical protein D4R64_14305 [Porphyromonadaceae bacterium]
MNQSRSIFLFALLIIAQLSSVSAQQQQQVLNKRMAGYHYSVVFTGEAMPSSAAMTYPVKTFDYQNYNFLVKFMPCLSVGGKIIYPSSFSNIKVEDIPGGVEATFTYESTRITTRITPLLVGRGAKTWTGAALYDIQTSPAREVLVLLGKGRTLNLFSEFATSFMAKDTVITIDKFTRIDDQSIVFLSGKDGLHVVVKGSEPVVAGKIGDQNKQVYVRMAKGSGYVLTVFSDQASDMENLRKLNAAAERTRVKKYYEELYKTSLNTPEPVMNEAFASALYNLEYNWLEPFGWGECLHHWLALWHMQVGAAADLIGQTDRSKSCIIEHAQNLLKNGAVPQFMPNKATKRDFGGSNSYWVWQVRHYLNYTGDKEFAKLIMPYVDTVIGQTLKEYDKDGDFLPSWGLQIGNQEDFLANPYNGSVPSMELYNMFMTRAELSKFAGDSATASLWFNKAAMVHGKLYKELWMNDLGRFGYYKDPTGVLMPDGQYQTYLYPIIYDLVDEYDKYSGLRHLRDRLTGENGAVFLSNNFPWHATGIACTWGMQCGEAQQPWAAEGFSKSGLNNETWRPLKAMADWAQDINHRGSWPETGPEPTPAYFTPPAGLYLVAVTEALIGINVHAPEGYVEVSPSLPDHWPYAKLNLPDFQVDYTRKQNQINYVISSSKDLPLKVRWRLPVSKIVKCTVNNKEVHYTIIPGVNHIVLCFDVPHTAKSALKIEFEPVIYKVNAPQSIASGEKLEISVEGATIERVMDRYGVLENVKTNSSSSFSSKVQARLLDPYQSFNQLGLLNFSRRTFFLDCRTTDGSPFIAAVDLNILPRFEVASVGNANQTGKNTIRLKVRNNTGKSFTGQAGITLPNTHFLVPVKLASRSDQLIDLTLPLNSTLSSGDNIATFILPGEAPVSVHFTLENPVNAPRFVSIKLPAKDLMPDTLWTTIRIMPGFPHIFFTFSDYGVPKPMWALKNVKEIEAAQIPGLKFQIPGTNFIPVSHLAGKVSYKLDLERTKYKKLYLLVIPFVDNHNIFAPVARITAYGNKEIVYTRTLNYPGDVDYWVPDKNPTSFASFREPRPDRFELLALLNPDMPDWKEGNPPAFPQPRWWSTSLPVVTKSCMMSIIEINLNKPGELDYLIFETIGVMPAFGIVAVTAELEE